MKTILTFFYSALILLITLTKLQASEIVAVVNGGNWSSNQTWSLNRLPGDGDIVVIPNGITLNVTNNEYNSVPSRPKLTIEVGGTLALTSGSGQLNLKCGSKLCTVGSGIILSSGCNCNQIAIGLGEAVWKGSYPSVSGGDCIEGCGSVLPIELVSFRAQSTNQFVMLLWETALEKNFHSFELERSLDGIHFNTLSIINAHGGEYSYIDANPISGTSYYRLKQVDTDNSFTYSTVIHINVNSSTPFTLSPNPSTGETIKVSLSTNDSSVSSIAMYDMTGNTVAIDILIENENTLFIKYFSSITRGIYSIVLTESDRITTQKIMIQ